MDSRIDDSHPLGVHGHAAVSPVGMTDKQDGAPGTRRAGDDPARNDQA